MPAILKSLPFSGFELTQGQEFLRVSGMRHCPLALQARMMESYEIFFKGMPPLLAYLVVFLLGSGARGGEGAVLELNLTHAKHSLEH